MVIIYKAYIKRTIDIVISLLALVILSPLILIVTVLVRVVIGSPVIFKQCRSGKLEKIFTIYKFRTMTDERDESGKLMPEEVRLTKFGKYLRSTSIDEIPEFINIIKGDMSIVGPRPLLVSYLSYYDNTEKRRHEVRPGLTGLAQINGRNATTWDERLKYDVQYVDHVNFASDIKIICSTIAIVLKREGISSENHPTMESFIERKKVGL